MNEKIEIKKALVARSRYGSGSVAVQSQGWLGSLAVKRSHSWYCFCSALLALAPKGALGILGK